MDQVGATAVRSLGIDIGNLTARLAIQNAVFEDLIQKASMITPMAWERQTVEEGNEAIAEGSEIVSVTGDEAEKVLTLIGTVLALR